MNAYPGMSSTSVFVIEWHVASFEIGVASVYPLSKLSIAITASNTLKYKLFNPIFLCLVVCEEWFLVPS